MRQDSVFIVSVGRRQQYMTNKTCPNCKKNYVPDYSYDDAKDGTIFKEQHISGICSDGCWDEFLGLKHKEMCMCVECLG